jgi:long-chain acyl-CoA synthetase
VLPPELASDQQPWLRLYDNTVPARLQARHIDALSVFQDCVASCPNSIAIANFGRLFSYLDLDALSNSLAYYLQTRGVARGDRVVVALQNTPEFIFMCLAAWKLAAVPLPVNPMYRRPELAKIFADAEPALLLCEQQDAVEMAGGLADAGCRSCAMTVTDPRDFGLNFDFGMPATATNDLGHPRLAKILNQHAGRAPTQCTLGADDLGLLLYTSGTTGVPKGTMILHRSLAFNAQLLETWCGLSKASRVWALAPFFHITGLVCHILASFSAQGTLIMHYRFHPQLALYVIRSAKPTFAIGAMTAFNALMNTPGSAREDFACFDRIYSGGAPVPPALANTFAEKFGVPIYPAYGMTETTAPTHLAPFGLRAPVDPVSGALSIGVPVPSTDAGVIDDDGRLLPPGGIGELVMRGPQIMAGYWRKPAETEAALKDGWMHSGDVGFQDEQGWFYLLDRKKDVIIASGFKVWPREVEDVLYAHSAVREAAVVGVADAYRGETVKAFVSLVPQATASAEELIRHCRDRLAAYKAPRSIEVLDELPKTVTGKIQRVALRGASQRDAST